MDFVAVVDQVSPSPPAGRVTYSTLKRFQLDDVALEDVKNELIEGGAWRWMSGVMCSSGSTPPAPQCRLPHPPPTQTPLTLHTSYLAEKILTSCALRKRTGRVSDVHFARSISC